MAEPPPVGGQTGATSEPARRPFERELVGQARQVVVGGIDIGVRQRKEEIDAIEAHAIHLGGGGQVEHGIEIDGRFGIGTFADQPGPHGVMQGGKA